jgi:hypothetical protein
MLTLARVFTGVCAHVSMALQSLIRRGCCVSVVVMLCFVSGAFAGSVSVDVTASNPDVFDTYSVGPYTATVNGVPNTQVICDDFSDTTTLKTSYTDTVNTFSDLQNTLWGAYLISKDHDSLTQVTTLYEDAAWLTLELLNPSNSKSTIANIQFAIWALFNGNALTKDPGAQTILNGLPNSNSFSPGEFSNFIILTPTCSSGPGTCKGQEFFEVVPEGGSALIYLLLAAASCAAALFYRSRRQPSGLPLA